MSGFARNQMGEIRSLAMGEYRGAVTTAADLMTVSIRADGSVEIVPPSSSPRTGGGRAVRGG